MGSAKIKRIRNNVKDIQLQWKFEYIGLVKKDFLKLADVIEFSRGLTE